LPQAARHCKIRRAGDRSEGGAMKQAAWICSWVAVAAGCASLPGQSAPEVTRITDRPGVGYVFGTLTQTFVPKSRSAMFDDSYITHLCLDCTLPKARPSRVKVVGGESNQADPRFPGENGVLFLFEVPAGTHQLDRWYAREAYKTIVPEGKLRPLSFQVEPGEIIYVGNVHMDLTFGRNPLGAPVTTRVTPRIRDAFARDLSLLKAQHPELAADRVRPRVPPVGEWPQE
jgi:hypothetical protein